MHSGVHVSVLTGITELGTPAAAAAAAQSSGLCGGLKVQLWPVIRPLPTALVSAKSVLCSPQLGSDGTWKKHEDLVW